MELTVSGSIRIKSFKATANEKNDGVTIRGKVEFDGGYDFNDSKKKEGEILFILMEPFKTRVDFLKSLMKVGNTFLITGRLVVRKIKDENVLLLEIDKYGYGMASAKSDDGFETKKEKKEEPKKKPKQEDPDDDDNDEFPF